MFSKFLEYFGFNKSDSAPVNYQITTLPSNSKPGNLTSPYGPAFRHSTKTKSQFIKKLNTSPKEIDRYEYNSKFSYPDFPAEAYRIFTFYKDGTKDTDHIYEHEIPLLQNKDIPFIDTCNMPLIVDHYAYDPSERLESDPISYPFYTFYKDGNEESGYIWKTQLDEYRKNKDIPLINLCRPHGKIIRYEYCPTSEENTINEKTGKIYAYKFTKVFEDGTTSKFFVFPHRNLDDYLNGEIPCIAK
jgi:hypothetical protein